MTFEEDIREFSGAIIGILRHYDNGDIAAVSFPGRQVLGFYRKDRDVTTEFSGRVVSQGNTVIQFIYKK